MKTFIASMFETIAKKNTRNLVRLEFVGIVGMKIWPTSTAKDFEKRII